MDEYDTFGMHGKQTDHHTWQKWIATAQLSSHISLKIIVVSNVTIKHSFGHNFMDIPFSPYEEAAIRRIFKRKLEGEVPRFAITEATFNFWMKKMLCMSHDCRFLMQWYR